MPPASLPPGSQRVLHLQTHLAPALTLQHAQRYMQQGQWQQAEPLLLRLAQPPAAPSPADTPPAESPDAHRPDALHLLGQLHLMQGRPGQALVYLEQAQALGLGSAPFFNHLGVALRLLGQPRKALECYEKALAQQADFVSAWVNQGNAQRDLGQHENALRNYEITKIGRASCRERV